MDAKLQQYMEEKLALINSELASLIQYSRSSTRLKESMLYSIKAGGKRLRPVLLIATYEALGGKDKDVLPVACALEMVHTYSLIHDDLPAMDNDDFRRGMPTNHKKFDEATAILAGDALLTYSFEILAKTEKLTAEQKVELIRNLAEAAGPDGMIAGQQLDMEAENKTITLAEQENVHALKTGKLLEFAVFAGARLGEADKAQLRSLKSYARLLGIIFQIQDDILDVSGDQEKLGKPVGSDQINFKSTYPALLGLEGAIQKKQEYTWKAKQELENAGVEKNILAMITDYLATRDY